MTKKKSQKRPLTAEEIETAKRLKRIFNEKKKALGFSQLSAALAMGWKSQSAVGQYLNANIALNTNALLKFAKFLQIPVTDIDPDFRINEYTSQPDPKEKNAIGQRRPAYTQIDYELSQLQEKYLRLDATWRQRVDDFIKIALAEMQPIPSTPLYRSLHTEINHFLAEKKFEISQDRKNKFTLKVYERLLKQGHRYDAGVDQVDDIDSLLVHVLFSSDDV